MTRIHKRSFSDKLRIVPSTDKMGRFHANVYWASNNKKIGSCSADTKGQLDEQIGKLMDDYYRFSNEPVPEGFK